MDSERLLKVPLLSEVYRSFRLTTVSTCVECGRGNCGSYLEAGWGDMLTIGLGHMAGPRFSRFSVGKERFLFGSVSGRKERMFSRVH
jgi:hypothetical protein